MRPEAIEAESMRIIRDEIGDRGFDDAELAVVSRVVHATADPEFAGSIRFHPRAIEAGLAALRRGCTIVTDVRMVEAGISRSRLKALGGETLCAIDDAVVAAEAVGLGETRATIAMRRCADQMSGGIVAIGNAPTALLEVIRLWQQGAIKPALVVGVPVGYVKAAESKAALAALDLPFITVLGRKGGSPVAVAIVNALMRLVEAER